MIIVTHTGQTGAGRAFGSVKGLGVRARKSRCTLKIKSERTNETNGRHDFSQGDLLGPPALRRRFDNGAAYLAHSPTVVWSFDALGLLPRHARPLP